MRIRITVEDLNRLNSCQEGIQKFRERHGGDVWEVEWTREEQLEYLKTGGKYLGWFVENNLLPLWAMNGASLDGVSLKGASLKGASLKGAFLDGASLKGAFLDGASLIGASLDRVSLKGASLIGAFLDGASLDGAFLDGASLDGASLKGASLKGASLKGASLNGTIGLNAWEINADELVVGIRRA